MKKLGSLIAIVIMLFLFLGTNVSPVSADDDTNTFPDENSCTPIDFIFLVDQTGEGNNLRVEAVKWMLGVLGYDRLSSCPDTTHRMAVISYGGIDQQNDKTYVEIDMPLLPIDPLVSAGVEGWINQREQYNSFLVSHYMPYRDTAMAFEEAAKILRNAPPGAGQNRKQVIVLITGDGGLPCTNSSPCTYTEAVEYKNNLSKLLEDELTFQKGVGPFIYFIAEPIDYIDGTRTFGLNKELKEIPEKNGGEYIEIEKPIDIPRSLMEIFSEVSNHTDIKQIGCGEINLDPFLQQVNFYDFRESTTNSFQISFEENDKQYSVINAEGDRDFMHLVDPPVGKLPQYQEYYIFKQPVPGNWRINFSGDCSKNLIYAFPIYANEISLLEPDQQLVQYNQNGAFFDPEKPEFMKFVVLGKGEQSNLRQYENYPAIVNGNITSPSGESYSLNFQYSNGQFVSREPLPVNEVGVYKWSIKFGIMSNGSEASEEPHFLIDQNGQYIVNTVTPFTFKIEEPVGDLIKLHKNIPGAFTIQDVNFAVRVVDSEGQEIPSSAFLKSDPNESLQIKMTNLTSGDSEEIFLKPALDDPSLFKGELENSLGGEGEYIVEVAFTGQADPTQYQLLNESVQKKFLRKDNFFSSPSVLIGILSLFTAGFLIGLGIMVYKFTNPVSGTLLFSRMAVIYENGIEKKEPFIIQRLDLEKQHRRKVVQLHFEDFNPLLRHIKRIDAQRSGEGVVISMVVKDTKTGNEKRIENKTFIHGKDMEEIPGGIFVSYEEDKDIQKMQTDQNNNISLVSINNQGPMRLEQSNETEDKEIVEKVGDSSKEVSE